MAWIVVERGAACCAPTNSLRRGALDGGLQRGEETFGQGVAAEEKSGVKAVAGEGVPEEWNGGDVAGQEAGEVVRIRLHELPDGEIAGEEKLDGAEERGEAATGHGAAGARPQAAGGGDAGKGRG